MRAKLEVAADYLVMAAWLAYLKSALLLPKDPLEEPSPDELALRLRRHLGQLLGQHLPLRALAHFGRTPAAMQQRTRPFGRVGACDVRGLVGHGMRRYTIGVPTADTKRTW